MLIEVKLPVKQLHEPLRDLSITGSVIFNVPIDVPPLDYLNLLPALVCLTLGIDAIHKKCLESWYSKESNGDTDLKIAPKVRLYILSTKLNETVIENLVK